MTWLLIEHAGSYLEQSMCAGHGPSHLLLLDEPLADDLVDSRLDKACTFPVIVFASSRLMPIKSSDPRRSRAAICVVVVTPDSFSMIS